MPLIRKPPPPAAATSSESRDALNGLESPNADDRWAAARGAGTAPGVGVRLAVAVRKERDPRVREAIFTALARTGGADELVSLLRSDDASLRTGALDALRILTRSNPQLLPALLQDSDTDVRILSCELAREISAEEATALLCAVLAAESQANVCAAAIDVLAEIGSASALPVLAECARKFADSPFLLFAIGIATDRIAAQSARDRG